jgi:hypothetical protein
VGGRTSNRTNPQNNTETVMDVEEEERKQNDGSYI